VPKSVIVATPAPSVVDTVDRLLLKIRRKRGLVDRLRRLLRSDTNSACQRVFNASTVDLRQKIIHAGLEAAGETAVLYELPTVVKPIDVREYSTKHTLELAARMGIISPRERRRLRRAYGINKDLEREDVDCEVPEEDCFLIFRTCIDIVLSRKPVRLIQVTDLEELAKSQTRVSLSSELRKKFTKANAGHQADICKSLILTAKGKARSSAGHKNAIRALSVLQSELKRPAQRRLVRFFEELLDGRSLEIAEAKIAAAAGIMRYIDIQQRAQLFKKLHERFLVYGEDWDNHQRLFDDFTDVGGFECCPAEPRRLIVLWMVKCYIGRPGTKRKVYKSDAAAPLIEDMFKHSAIVIAKDVEKATKDEDVKSVTDDTHVARRLEELLDLISSEVVDDDK
jgi:hypothetical protein